MPRTVRLIQFTFIIVIVSAYFASCQAEQQSKAWSAIIAHDDRKQITDYNGDNSNLSGTQVISCNDKKSFSVNFIKTRDILLTVAHGLIQTDKFANVLLKSPERYFCRLQILDFNGEVQNYPLDIKTIVTGSINDSLPFSAEDWLIIKLKSPIGQVTPYQAPPTAEYDLMTTPEVEFISGPQSNFAGGTPSMRLIQSCRIKKQQSNVFYSDCNMGPGASGGAITVKDKSGNRILYGIGAASGLHTAPCPEYDEAKNCKSGGPLLTDKMIKFIELLAETTEK